MDAAVMTIGLLILFRIVTLSSERVAFHGLAQGETGALPTMGIAFWGAALLLWIVAFAEGQVFFIGPTVWTGSVYALAFGLYTASLAEGPVGSVSSWTNATILLLWLIQPTGGVASIGGIVLFSYGAWLLVSRKLTRAVVMMLLSDVLYVIARLLDTAHTHFPLFAYAASLFTWISLWMSVPIVSSGQTLAVLRLAKERPGWSIAAASTNAATYLALFALIHWLPTALVEAVSALAGFASTLAGIIIFHESQGKRKVAASSLMTVGVLVLLFDHYGVMGLD